MCIIYILLWNNMGGIIVCVLTSRVVDHGFKPCSDQTEDYKSDNCCFSAKHAALRRKDKDCWPGTETMYLRRVYP